MAAQYSPDASDASWQLRILCDYVLQCVGVDGDERPDIFIDRDADTFAVLLSCMRSRAVLLPEADLALCTRVLYDAEFYGMQWLLNRVKAKTVRHDGGFDSDFLPSSR